VDAQIVYVVWALIHGTLSAASLPLGSVVGVLLKPNRLILGSLSAFGGGALLAALSVELVAPNVAALVAESNPEEKAEHIIAFVAMVGCAILGGLLFITLDQIVNAKGGFLRKYSTTINYLTRQRRKLYREMVDALSNIEVLRKVPPDVITNLVKNVQSVSYTKGMTIFREGDRGHSLIIIRDGEIELSESDHPFKTLGRGEIIGEIALLTGAPRNATAVAVKPVKAFLLPKEDFENLRTALPEFDAYLRKMASHRIRETASIKETRTMQAKEWSEKAIAALHEGSSPPTQMEIKKVRQAHTGSPMAIWLGILLDGIPESFIIGIATLFIIAAKLEQTGSVTFAETIPYTLIAGLFISNFPEALSSSVGMREQGFSAKKILWLWTSLMIMTAIGALFGCWLGESLPHIFVVGIEGLAAGAMLTMIAATMLPEAAHVGGSYVSGLSTTLGFLAALAFKLLE